MSTPGTCAFCEIVAGDAAAVFVARWTHAVAIEPRGPVTDGHILVIPNKHVADFTEDEDVTAQTARYASRLGRELGASANLITSKGAPATQSVFHLHWHLVPRRPGDRLLLPWGGQR